MGEFCGIIRMSIFCISEGVICSFCIEKKRLLGGDRDVRLSYKTLFFVSFMISSGFC